MKPGLGKRRLIGKCILAICVLTSAVFVLRGYITDQWYLWKLESEIRVVQWKRALSFDWIKSIPGGEFIARLFEGNIDACEVIVFYSCRCGFHDGTSRCSCGPSSEEMLYRSRVVDLERSEWKVVLPRIGKKAVPVLLDALKEQDVGTQARAVWALGQIGPCATEAIAALIEIEGRPIVAAGNGMFASDPEILRFAATKALKNIQGE